MVTIASIEKAICERLREGLGGMVTRVLSWDVMTNDIGVILNCLPGAFVTFTGITSSQPHDTRRMRDKVRGRFAVYVCDYNLRENEAIRHGGVNDDEPGCYRLIRSVRRLLMSQDLGLEIQGLRPATVRVVTSKALAEKAIAMYECLFETAWFEDALENQSWPEVPEDPAHPDNDFVRWGGRLDQPYLPHNSTHGEFTADGRVVAESTVSHLKTEDDHD